MSSRRHPIQISVVVPSYNTPKHQLENLYLSLLTQSFPEFEVIVVDDCSDFHFYDILKDDRIKVVYRTNNSGPAICRNLGAEHARAQFLFFTDSDCRLDKNTLKVVFEKIQTEDLIAGNTITKAKTHFGKAVALLGFPGGGALGFDRVWKVDKNGYTDSVSSCNFAIKNTAFLDLKKFNTSFPVPGGEDTVFAKTAIKKNYKIKYSPTQIVYHVERSSMASFIKWQITRGRGNYYIKNELVTVRNFLKLRSWSIKNSFMKAGLIYSPIVFFLMFLSICYQAKGYYREKHSNRIQ